MSPEEEERIRRDERTRVAQSQVLERLDHIGEILKTIETTGAERDETIARIGRLASDLWNWRQEVESAFHIAEMNTEEKAAVSRMTKRFLRGEERTQTWYRRLDLWIPLVTGVIVFILSQYVPKIPIHLVGP